MSLEGTSNDDRAELDCIISAIKLALIEEAAARFSERTDLAPGGPADLKEKMNTQDVPEVVGDGNIWQEMELSAPANHREWLCQSSNIGPCEGEHHFE